MNRWTGSVDYRQSAHIRRAERQRQEMDRSLQRHRAENRARCASEQMAAADTAVCAYLLRYIDTDGKPLVF